MKIIKTVSSVDRSNIVSSMNNLKYCRGLSSFSGGSENWPPAYSRPPEIAGGGIRWPHRYDSEHPSSASGNFSFQEFLPHNIKLILNVDVFVNMNLGIWIARRVRLILAFRLAVKAQNTDMLTASDRCWVPIWNPNFSCRTHFCKNTEKLLYK